MSETFDMTKTDHSSRIYMITFEPHFLTTLVKPRIRKPARAAIESTAKNRRSTLEGVENI